jgi:hypothetical protein
VLAQVSGRHGDRSAGAQASARGVGIDLLGGFGQRPAVRLAPCGARPQPVTPGELGDDLPVTHPQFAHAVSQGTLLAPQACSRIWHAHPAFPASREVTGSTDAVINGSRPESLLICVA